MSDWIEQYSAALTERDAREQAHKPYIDAYTRLADKTAASTKQASPAPPSTPTPDKDRATSTATPSKSRPSTSSPIDATADNDLLPRLRADLSTTQKARSALQSQLTALTSTLVTLHHTLATSQTQLAALQRQKADLERKVRDRDDELRGKGRLVEQAQDEMVALQLQLHVCEEKAERLGRDNEDLVRRWVARMGEEVERVNRDSRWE